MIRIGKHPPQIVKFWADRLWATAKTAYLPVKHHKHRVALVAFGALLSMVGDGEDLEAVEAYRAFCLLVVGGGRAPQWRKAVAEIPADRDRILELVRTLRAYEDLAARGYWESMTTAAGLRVRDVTRTAVRLGADGPDYLDAVRDEWFTHPNRAFSEEAVQKAAGKLRGALGAFAGGDRDAHVDQLTEGVRVVG